MSTESCRATVPVPFATAGDLVRLLRAMPPGTPVRLAETVRIADDLDLDHTPAETVIAAGAVHAGDGRGAKVAAVELGMYVVARGGAPPVRAVPFPAYESAVEALERGDTGTALRAQIELLEWMAGTLAATDADPERPPGATAAVADPLLREHLDIESRRIRNTARRLDVLRARITERGRSREHPRPAGPGDASDLRSRT